MTRARGDGRSRQLMRWVPRTYPQVVLLSIACGTTWFAVSGFNYTESVRAKALQAAGITVLSLVVGSVKLRSRRADSLAPGALGSSPGGADGDAAERWSREHPADFLSRAATVVRVGGDQETVTRTDG